MAPPPKTSNLSSKALWLLISGSTQLKSLETVRSELNANAEKILLGLSYYKEPCSSLVNQQEWSAAAEAIPQDVMRRIKQILQVDEKVVGNLFYFYLLYEFKGTTSNVPHLFNTDKSIQKLLRDLWTFYRQEKLFLLGTLKEIIGHSSIDSSHPYKKLFGDFIVKHDVEPKGSEEPKWLASFISEIFASRENLRVNSSSHLCLDEEMYLRDRLYTTKEICEMLQILVIYSRRSQISLKLTLDMLKEFSTSVYDLRRVESYHDHLVIRTDDELDGVKAEIKQISSMALLLESTCVISSLDISDLLTRSKPLDQNQQRHLIDMNAFILNQSDHIGKNMPLITLGWLLIRSCENSVLSVFDSSDGESLDKNVIIRQLGQLVLQFNSFEWISANLQNPIVKQHDGNPFFTALFDCIYDLIHSTFAIFEVENMVPVKRSIYSVVTLLLAQDTCSSRLMSESDPLESGLGTVLSYAMGLFPFETNSLLTMLNSIAQCSTKTCTKLVSILRNSNPRVICERFDPSSPNVIPFDQAGTYQLAQSKMLYGSPLMTIPARSLGQISQVNDGQVLVIQWQGVSVDYIVWLSAIFKYHLDNISDGFAHSSSAKFSLESEMVPIAQFCSAMLSNCPKSIEFMHHVADLAINAFNALSHFPRPPRVLMASILFIGEAILTNHLSEPRDVWNSFVTTRFFPYMIGLKGQDVSAISRGLDTDSSLLSDMIIAQESVQANYQLSFAFLTFVRSYLQSIAKRLHHSATHVQFGDSNLLASTIFIVNYIYPSYLKWNYGSERLESKQTPARIGRLCLDIFSIILNCKIDETKEPQLHQLKSVVVHALMNGHAGEVLLEAVYEAQESVKSAVEEVISSEALRTGSDSILVARSSLQILNKLLALAEQNMDDHDEDVSDHTKKDIQRSTPLEKVLFSPIGHGRSHMLLVACHLGTQRYDCHLSTHAIDLLRRLAIHFPMSMLACLGPDSESVRDHFLFRLDTITEDLWLKVSLLRFMSVCIVHQPGLMELFLQTGEIENGASQRYSCFQTVIEILQEKKGGHFLCPDELHYAALDFVFSFWFQSHSAAIEYLRNSPNIWELICFPLVASPRSIDTKVTPLILKLLAREIFYTLSRDKPLHGDLKSILADFIKSKKIIELSAAISSFVQNPKTPITQKKSILRSYRDFSISLAVMCPIQIDDTVKVQIVSDSLDLLVHILSLEPRFFSLIPPLAESMLVILSHWKGLNLPQATVEQLNHLAEVVASKCLVIPFGSLGTLNYLTALASDAFIKNSWQNETLVHSACQLVTNSSRVLEKSLYSNRGESSSDCISAEMKWAVSCVTLLNGLVSQGIAAAIDQPASSEWVLILRTHSIVELMLSTCIALIDQQLALPYADASISLLVTLSSWHETGRLIVATGMLDNLTLTLQNVVTSETDTTCNPAEKDYLARKGAHLQTSWTKVFYSVIRLMSSLSRSLKVEFREVALNFIAVHATPLEWILSNVARVPCLIDLHGSIYTTELMSSIFAWWNWKNFSYAELPPTLVRLLERIYKTCNATVAFLSRPQLLAVLLSNPESRDILSKNLLVPSLHNMHKRPNVPSLNQSAINLDLSVLHSSSVTKLDTSKVTRKEGTDSFLPDPPNMPLTKSIESLLKESKKQPSSDDESISSSASSVKPALIGRDELTMDMESCLFDFVARTLSLMSLTTPSVLHLFSQQGLVRSDEWRLLLDLNFASPSIDEDANLSFGSLLSCMSFSLKPRSRSHRMDSRSASPVKSTNDENRECMELILEHSLSLLISQGLVALLSQDVNERDREHISRELKSEISTLKSAATRQSKRTSSSGNESLSSRSSSPSGKAHLLSQPFIKLLLNISEKMF